VNHARQTNPQTNPNFRVTTALTRIAVFTVISAITLVTATASFASGVMNEASPWQSWNLTWEVTLGTLIVAGLYSRGIWRLKHKTDSARIWRHISFFTGLLAVFLALQSPIDAIAERSFLIHQVQHLLVRMIGPMLIFLSAPQGVFVAGMPDPIQRHVVNPILTNQAVGGFFRIFTYPAVATAVFVGALYIWQYPPFHNAAVLDDNLHYFMHTSMLFAGFLFFWRIFDPRPAPQGAGYATRLMMLWVMVLSNIALGSYLALKTQILYAAYDVNGRLWHPPLADEQLGAAIIWIPNGMMGLIAVLIVIHMWGCQETKDEKRRIDKLARYGHGWNEPPMTAAELIETTAGKNRATGLKLAFFSLCVFASAILFGVGNLIAGN
jgi:putative membrane protein